MVKAHMSIQTDYWENFEIEEEDLEFLYNHLLELERPQTSHDLATALIQTRILQEKKSIEEKKSGEGKLYLPKEQYDNGDIIYFSSQDMENGEVVNVRKGNNPDLPDFSVIDVKFDNGDIRSFASELEEHKLNNPVEISYDDPNLNADVVIKGFGKKISKKLKSVMQHNPNLVCVAGNWFPQALLLDINIGHLNLAEAVLDMENGGPLSTKEIMEQIDIETDDNQELTEFSFNLALLEDERFDEIGPAGEILWFLHRLEPDEVKKAPVYLEYSPIEFDQSQITELYDMLGDELADELESDTLQNDDDEEIDSITINLLYPHWRAGTLPLTPQITQFFPTAYEAPRVKFTFIDGNTKEKLPGWVVRPFYYVYGLKDWYSSQELIPGSIIHIERSENPGEVIIRADIKRPSREWIRTVLVGADGGIVFAMLKQLITAKYDERSAIATPDVESIDRLWQNRSNSYSSLEKSTKAIMKELAKLNPQSHVHAQELYAAVNVIRRCPPGPILHILATNPWATHMGDLYFRPSETSQED